MKAEVSRCAKEITGDDRPRKLDPQIRAKVTYDAVDLFGTTEMPVSCRFLTG